MVLILSSLILEQQLAMQYPSQPLLFQITSRIAAKLTSSCIPRMNMEIINVTENLKSITSEGFDNISMKIIKTTMHEVAMPLAHIFNQSFLTGTVPDNMKIAKIVPIFKSGNKKKAQQLQTDMYSPCFLKTIGKTRMQSACKLPRDT